MISAPSPITLSLLSTQPLVRIFIPITPLCTSPSVPKYLFPKPFPTPSPSQPSVLHPTYSQPHSDSQEPVLPSRVPLLSCSSSSLAPQALASCGPLRPPLPPDTPFPLISPFPDVPLGGTPLFCPFLFPTPGVARPPSLPASLSLPLCPSHSCARSPPSPPPSSLLNSCPSPVLLAARDVRASSQPYISLLLPSVGRPVCEESLRFLAVEVARAVVGAAGSQPSLLPRGPNPLCPAEPGMEAPPRHPLSSPPQDKCPP